MRFHVSLPLAAVALLAACSSSETDTDDTDEVIDTEVQSDPFADAIVSFTPGEGAGFGAEHLPDIVLGGPQGAGASAGSADVLSLGMEGSIVLRFDDLGLIDGEGADLLVFENAFSGFTETARVAVSEDGTAFSEWPCDPDDDVGGFPGCAGVQPVHANATNGLDATDPDAAGGDRFDLADLGLARARFVRITDTGANGYAGTSGGFDLDALAVVHSEALP